MNTTPLRVSFTCPCCTNKGYFGLYIKSFAEIARSTTECGHCEATLIVLTDGTVAPFHEWLNGQDPNWPKDGKATGSVTIA